MAMTQSAPWNPVVLWSKPEHARPGTPLLVLFHGYQANEEDLMGIVDSLPGDFTVASIRAPLAVGQGYTWFPLTQELDYPLDEVITAASETLHWLESIRDQHKSVSLLGFSMGMAMATTLMRHRPEDFAAVVGLSGFAVSADGNAFFKDAELAEQKVPFFWGRDQEDPVITAERIEFTHAWLSKHTAMTKILYAGMWHGISAQELAHVKEFLSLTVLKQSPR